MHDVFLKVVVFARYALIIPRFNTETMNEPQVVSDVISIDLISSVV